MQYAIFIYTCVIGPRESHPACRDTSDANHWSCCTSLTSPCIANLASTNGAQSHFVYDVGKGTMVPTACKLVNDTSPPATSIGIDECCQTVPWIHGMNYGFRYRLRHPYLSRDAVKHHATQTFHNALIYPHGASTYALSKGLLNVIGRKKFEKMLYALQCYNADVNVMVAVLNSGYSITQFEFSAIHDVRDVHAFADIALTNPSSAQTTKDAVCSWPFNNPTKLYSTKCTQLCPQCVTTVNDNM